MWGAGLIYSSYRQIIFSDDWYKPKPTRAMHGAQTHSSPSINCINHTTTTPWSVCRPSPYLSSCMPSWGLSSWGMTWAGVEGSWRSSPEGTSWAVWCRPCHHWRNDGGGLHPASPRLMRSCLWSYEMQQKIVSCINLIISQLRLQTNNKKTDSWALFLVVM